MILKYLIKSILFLFFALFLILSAFYIYIDKKALPYQYSNPEALPNNLVAIILGTNKFIAKNTVNLYYKYRIEAAIELYKSGKVKYFIVSGDNRRSDYNEPKVMRADLIKGGIPDKNIISDYAGFRTLDSILRAKQIFGLDEYVIVSQPFHNARALFLAHSHGHKALAFNAKTPSIKTNNVIKVEYLRESFARAKALLDIITNKQAYFAGEKIKIPEE